MEGGPSNAWTGGIGGASPHGGNGAQQLQTVPYGNIPTDGYLSGFVDIEFKAAKPGGGGTYSGDFTTYPTCGRVIVWEYQ
jgi:hypothetical protein